jgi:hypothetical protein
MRLRFRYPLGVGAVIGTSRGTVIPDLSSGIIPEPDEELPDSDLSDVERRAAIIRERWRRESRH